MYKSKLRSQVLHELKQLEKDMKEKIERTLCSHLFNSHLFKNASVIGTTFSQYFEWDTSLIIEKAWKNGKTIVAPKTYPMKRELHFFKIDSNSKLEKGFKGILEPDEESCEKIDKNKIDLLIVPGIVFDKYGYRIGFGGGYYDRFLTDFNQATISLASKLQLIEKIPVQSFDIPVDFLVTEEGLYRTKIQ